ncbi:MAG: hypothetical protein AAGL89_07325 [Pseudomonadota bacterium]
MSLLGENGSGIVMTDLFISATAALLLVLAVARPSPPVALPVQADLSVTCVPTDAGSVAFQVSPFEPKGAEASIELVHDIETPSDFVRAVHDLSPETRLLLKVALSVAHTTDGSQHASGLTCLRVFQQDFMRPLNREPQIDVMGESLRSPIVAVALVQPNAQWMGIE